MRIFWIYYNFFLEHFRSCKLTQSRARHADLALGGCCIRDLVQTLSPLGVASELKYSEASPEMLPCRFSWHISRPPRGGYQSASDFDGAWVSGKAEQTFLGPPILLYW